MSSPFGAPLSEPLLAHIAHNLMAVKMYSLATFVMVYYDIILTFGDEVERVWKKKFTWFTALWFLNRYLPPAGFAVLTLAFQDSAWTRNDKFCNIIAFFPGMLGGITSGVVDTIFIVRVYATYSANKAILCFMISLLVAKEVIVIWSITSGQRQPLPPGLVGCILVPGSSSLRFTSLWIAQLSFDSTVFALTIYRSLKLSRIAGGGVSSLINLIMRDGIIYFAVIFVADVVNVLTFLLAPSDLQALNASMTLAIAPLMVSRLILNLRGADDTQKNHMRLSGMGSDNSAKRGTPVPGPNPRPRYKLIFVADLLNVLTFLLAPAINASMTLAIGLPMVSRLILNLRGADPAHKTRVPQISGSNGSGTGSNSERQQHAAQ